MSLKDKALQVMKDFDAVYEAGKRQGGGGNTDEKYWNAFTVEGTRVNYNYGFAYSNFEGQTIPQGLCKPKSSMGYMFHQYTGKYLPEGIDCSEFNTTVIVNNQCYYTFYYAQALKKIYDMQIPAGAIYNNTYGYCYELEEIEKIRCNETTTFNTNNFLNCLKLKHCIFDGTMTSDINLQWSKNLDEESFMSLVIATKNYNLEVNDPEAYTKTVTLSAETWAMTSTDEWYAKYAATGKMMFEGRGWITV